MAHTYTQLNIHAVFVVKHRKHLLTNELIVDLSKYTTGIIKNLGMYPLATGGHLDHIHTFFELDPKISVSKALQQIKANTSRWINKQGLLKEFQWQPGFAAFSYSRSQRKSVINYILRQEAHHSKHSFKKEYIQLLKRFEVPYEDQHLFDFFE